MLMEQWMPMYSDILSDMGYSREDDERSARILCGLLKDRNLIMIDELSERIGSRVTVFGAGPKLEMSLKHIGFEGTLISAGSATGYLLEAGIIPHIVVTDLDGDVEMQKEASAEGAWTIIHAHGDNMDLLKEHVKDFKGPVLPSTQSIPEPPAINFGGFTDGDRAVCMAAHMGTKRIDLVAFDYDHPRETGPEREVKLRKLAWAERIIDAVSSSGPEMFHVSR